MVYELNGLNATWVPIEPLAIITDGPEATPPLGRDRPRDRLQYRRLITDLKKEVVSRLSAFKDKLDLGDIACWFGDSELSGCFDFLWEKGVPTIVVPRATGPIIDWSGKKRIIYADRNVEVIATEEGTALLQSEWCPYGLLFGPEEELGWLLDTAEPGSLPTVTYSELMEKLEPKPKKPKKVLEAPVEIEAEFGPEEPPPPPDV